ncbi:hypothetical protein BKA80DRAFT_258456 [Phyllosticta citrichinensis]
MDRPWPAWSGGLVFAQSSALVLLGPGPVPRWHQCAEQAFPLPDPKANFNSKCRANNNKLQPRCLDSTTGWLAGWQQGGLRTSPSLHPDPAPAPAPALSPGAAKPVLRNVLTS